MLRDAEILRRRSKATALRDGGGENRREDVVEVSQRGENPITEHLKGFRALQILKIKL